MYRFEGGNLELVTNLAGSRGVGLSPGGEVMAIRESSLMVQRNGAWELLAQPPSSREQLHLTSARATTGGDVVAQLSDPKGNSRFARLQGGEWTLYEGDLPNGYATMIVGAGGRGLAVRPWPGALYVAPN